MTAFEFLSIRTSSTNVALTLTKTFTCLPAGRLLLCFLATNQNVKQITKTKEMLTCHRSRTHPLGILYKIYIQTYISIVSSKAL